MTEENTIVSEPSNAPATETIEPAAAPATEAAGSAPTETDAKGAESGETGGENKKTPWFQRRIDHVTGEKYEAVRRAEKAEQQATRLLEELAAARAGKAESAEGDTKPLALSMKDVEELADKKAEEKAITLAAKKQFDDACNHLYQQGTKEFGKDFDESIDTFKMLGGFPPGFLDIVTDMPDGHKILSHLGKDPDDAARILALSPTKQALELARLETALNRPAPKPISKAPDPIRTIDSGSGKSEFDLDDKQVPIKNWIKEREKQLAQKRNAR